MTNYCNREMNKLNVLPSFLTEILRSGEGLVVWLGSQGHTAHVCAQPWYLKEGNTATYLMLVTSPNHLGNFSK